MPWRPTPPISPAVFVRVSSVGTADFAPDADACRHPSLTTLMLPQVTGPEEVAAADAALDGTEARIMPLVETASAVRLAYELATASHRVAYMGGATGRHGDLGRSVGFHWTPEGTETLYLRQKVLIDVRSAGVPNPLSGLWGTIDDIEGLTAFAQQTRQLGYEGMMAIHPSQPPDHQPDLLPHPRGNRRLASTHHRRRIPRVPGHRGLPPPRPPHRPSPPPHRPTTISPRPTPRPLLTRVFAEPVLTDESSCRRGRKARRTIGGAVC